MPNPIPILQEYAMGQMIYQVDAFTSALFGGNPAAVCPLEGPMDDRLMQSIAMENNLSETAFIWPKPGERNTWFIRWFTPVCEIDLCGHATLASAYTLFIHEGAVGDEVYFESRKYGVLTVGRRDDWLSLDFPADRVEPADDLTDLESILGVPVKSLYKGRNDYMAVLENEQAVATLTPDIGRLVQLHCRALMVTARGDSVDFVSRFFAPRMGIDEDPVTGAAHTTLTPYWAEQLGKNMLDARQLSARGGVLRCELRGDRTILSGQAKTYLVGEIQAG